MDDHRDTEPLYRVGDALKFRSLVDVNTYLRDQGLVDHATAVTALDTLYEVLCRSELINYFLVTDHPRDRLAGPSRANTSAIDEVLPGKASPRGTS